VDFSAAPFRSFPDVAAAVRSYVGAMDGKTLRHHWLNALDTAVHAVEAASQAHTLPPDQCSRLRKKIAAERAWVDRAPWR
jgi:hypothetical protein